MLSPGSLFHLLHLPALLMVLWGAVKCSEAITDVLIAEHIPIFHIVSYYINVHDSIVSSLSDSGDFKKPTGTY